MMSIRDWVRRHKRTLLLSAGAVGAGYFLYRTIKSHYINGVMEIEKHTSLLRQAEQRIEAQLQIHFHSIQRISDTTTLPTLLPRLKSQLFCQIDLSGLTEKLAQGKDAHQALTGQERIELWEELKILSFTRAACSMWALTILVLFVRVQLNILARHVYIDTARNISTSDQVDQRRALSKVCQQKYIALAEFLPDKGIEMLISDMKVAVVSALASKSLKEPCSLADLRAIFESICSIFECSKVNWLAYMLPKEKLVFDGRVAALVASDTAKDGEKDVALHDEAELVERLLGETRDILDSQEFREVLVVSFDTVLDGAMEDFKAQYEGGDERVPLAKLLSLVAGIGALLLEQPDENRFIQLITNQQGVQSFCATVYSAAGG